MENDFFHENVEVLYVFARVIDCVIIFLAAIISNLIRFGNIFFGQNYLILVSLCIITVYILFPKFNLYATWRGRSLLIEIRTLLLAWLIIFAGIAIVFVYTKASANYSRLWLGQWWLISAFVLSFFRFCLRSFFWYLRKNGLNYKQIVIIGKGDLGSEAADHLKRTSWAGFHVLGFFDDSSDSGNGKYPLLGSLKDIKEYVENNHVDQIWFAMPLKAEEIIKKILADLQHCTVEIKYILDIFGIRLVRHSITEIAGIPIISLSSTPIKGINWLQKSIIDRVLALILLSLLLPVFIIIGIGIKISSPGPVLFKQKRHGFNGSTIEIWKFRTMKAHTEEKGVVTQAKKNDDRITRFGVFLRSTSLDELPQFFNVLQGNMSMVGPRPHPVELNEYYQQYINKYGLRHKVKPGITGWAQVNGWRGETEVKEKMAKRIEYDLYYIENWSIWFDIKILVSTIFKGFKDKNAY